VVSVTGLVLLGWKLGQLGQILHQITAAVTYNVLQGRRIEEVLREMRDPLGEMREPPAR